VRRAVALAAVAALTLLATGCEEPGQHGAREAVETHLRALPDRARYGDLSVHCTHDARYGYFGSARTRRYFCTARVEASGDCDLFQADALVDGTARVVLVRRDAGCVLPAG
jgi:hypothetical protein